MAEQRTPFFKFGRNRAVTTEEDIVEQGGTLAEPAATGTAVVVAAAADSAATQGMRVKWFGTDTAGLETSGTVTLNSSDSTTEVAVGTLTSIYRAFVLGSTTMDQNILFGPSGLGSTYLQITSPDHQSQHGAYRVAANEKLTIRRFLASIQEAAAAADREVTVVFKAKFGGNEDGGVYRVQFTIGLGTGGTSCFVRDFEDGEMTFPPQTTIKASAFATASSDIAVHFSGYTDTL